MRKNDRHIRKINGDIINVHWVAVFQTNASAAAHACADPAVAGVKNHRQTSFRDDFVKRVNRSVVRVKSLYRRGEGGGPRFSFLHIAPSPPPRPPPRRAPAARR